MKKTTLALGSFIVGACCMSLLDSGMHTSTRVQASQQPPSPPALPPSTITMLAAIPIVPPLQYFGHGDTIGGNVQQLDGFSCDGGCTIAPRILTYGGGAFSFPVAIIPKGVPIVFTGAAANTVLLMTATGMLPAPKRPAPVPLPGGQIIQADMEISAQPKIALVSLAGVKK
jgi:hypothetical protein